jgi:hypothetical protein
LLTQNIAVDQDVIQVGRNKVVREGSEDFVDEVLEVAGALVSPNSITRVSKTP